MSELIHQLGIDWRLLVSQAVNFLLLLAILRIFAYKPILKILKDRRVKVEEGLEKAKVADTKLQEINQIAKEKLKEAEREALEILRQTEVRAKEVETKLLSEAKEKESTLIKQTMLVIRGKEEESRQTFRKEAAELVKAAIAKTVELAPETIDEALVKKAVAEVQKGQ